VLAELQSVLDSLSRIPREQLPELLGELEVVRATAVMRLSAPVPCPDRHDELLSVEQAADRLGVSEKYLYTHHPQFSFTCRMGRKLLFSSSGIDEHIKKRAR